MDGWITHIQPFSLHDGPGVRTTIFFAGCNLRCRWCHNPEALFPRPRLQFHEARCVGCGRCAAACPPGCIGSTPLVLDRGRCTACGICAQACRHGALALSCRKIDSGQAAAELLEDSAFFAHTGGGVTFSGGEPFLQPQFLRSLAGCIRKQGIHTAVETAADVDYAVIRETLPLLDLVICDLKAMDEKLHRAGTGVSNRLILENLARMSRDARRLWVRIPLIPSYNDSTEELESMGDFLAPLGVEKAELLPYHRLGIGKYRSLGLEPGPHDYTTPADANIAVLQESLNRMLAKGS